MYIFNRHSRALAECSRHSLTRVHIWLSVILTVCGFCLVWGTEGVSQQGVMGALCKAAPTVHQMCPSGWLGQKKTKKHPPTMLWGTFRDESGISKEPWIKDFKGWRTCFQKFHLATASVSEEDEWTAAWISSLTQETVMLSRFVSTEIYESCKSKTAWQP